MCDEFADAIPSFIYIFIELFSPPFIYATIWYSSLSSLPPSFLFTFLRILLFTSRYFIDYIFFRDAMDTAAKYFLRTSPLFVPDKSPPPRGKVMIVPAPAPANASSGPSNGSIRSHAALDIPDFTRYSTLVSHAWQAYSSIKVGIIMLFLPYFTVFLP